MATARAAAGAATANGSPAKLTTTLKDAEGNPWTIESIQMEEETFVDFVKRHRNRVEILKTMLGVVK